MTRPRHKLNAKSLAALKSPGKYSDGDGLYLIIRERGDGLEKRWAFIYRRGPRGKTVERHVGLGPARDVSLADARAKAAQCRRDVAEGLDPRLGLKKNQGIPTFGEVAGDLVKSLRPSFKNAKHAAQWESTLSRDYCRPLWDKRVDQINTQDVLAVLQPIWQKTPETASRLRGRIERVLSAAKVNHYRTGDNPALWRGHLQMLLPAPRKLARGHHAALPWKAMPEFIERLRALRSVSALALEWTILTACRTNECIQARKAEIDRGARIWTIPAGRMKARREHRVPLSSRCMAILEYMDQIDSEWIFPARVHRKHMSQQALSECLKGIETGCTVHGFRSTFRDWVGDATSYPEVLAEAALAHVIGDKTEAAYRRGDALERRRELMTSWERYLEPSSQSNVVRLSR